MTMRKKTKMKNYDFCYGMGVNWVEMETGKMYHIQEYREKIEKGEHPEGIRVTVWDDPSKGTIEIVGEYTLRQRMADEDPDPRYLPETAEEHRRNF